VKTLVTLWIGKEFKMDRAVVMGLLAELAGVVADVAAGVDCVARARELSIRFNTTYLRWKKEDDELERGMLGLPSSMDGQ
jgi:hypothetical protein